MGRIIFFVILALLGYLLFRSLTKGRDPAISKDPPPASVDSMVACARCGVNIPKGSAQQTDQGWRCQEGELCGHYRQDANRNRE
jgi:hypothetical protein